MIKTENINFRISKEQKEALEKLGEGNLSQAVSSAVDFFLTFPPGFMSEIKKIAEMVKLPIPIVIVHLLQVYSAQDTALIKYFGKSKTFQRAFRFDPVKGMITGDELSDLTFKDVLRELDKILEKKERSKQPGKKFNLTIDEASLLAHVL